MIDNNIIIIEHETISDENFNETTVCGMDDEESIETTQHGMLTSICTVQIDNILSM